MNMIRKKPTIRMNLIFFFTALILSALFMFLGISIQVTEDTVLENSTQYTRQLVTQVSSDIDNYINYMENISTMLATNVDIREYLSSSTLDKYREQELYNRILFQFDNILNMRNDIYNLAIYGENDKYVLNRGNDIINPYVDVKNMEWYAKAVEGNGKRILSSSHVQNLIYDDYKWVVTLSKAIRE
ncbi:MAG: histidine kinase, partial [Thermoanaerobacteraceae bacterium]|nr:histidine kinase [Thermoanaerobacteraceae bacterium]